MFDEEIKLAKEARLNAYAPTSKFLVGAALKTKSGKIYTGCNIENQGIQSICAERTAFVKALSEGEREFDYIIVVGALEGNDANNECLPCGYCRQFMSEFVDKNFKIVTLNDNTIKTYFISDLLPYDFSL